MFEVNQSSWCDIGPVHIIVFVLCIYSLIINYGFGHPTYWRKSPSFNTLAALGGGSDNRKTNSKRSTKTMSLVLQCVNEDILLSIWEHLTPLDLTITSQVSRKFRELSKTNSLWSELQSKLPVPKTGSVFSDDARVRYFETMMYVIQEMLQDPDKLVIYIKGELYDLTHFAAEHPGGDGVLTQYRGKDATIMFERVMHSAFALQLRENLLLFSPDEFKGARGWPKFCIKQIK